MENRIINNNNYEQYKLLDKILNDFEITYKNGKLKDTSKVIDIFMIGSTISVLAIPTAIWMIFSTPSFNFDKLEMGITMLSGIGTGICSSLFLANGIASKKIKKNIKRLKKDYPNINTNIEENQLKKELEKYEDFSNTVIIENKKYEMDDNKNIYFELKEQPKVKIYK